jgi:hypothetical protein
MIGLLTPSVMKKMIILSAYYSCSVHARQYKLPNPKEEDFLT